MAAVARGLVDDARIASCIVRSKFCYGDVWYINQRDSPGSQAANIAEEAVRSAVRRAVVPASRLQTTAGLYLEPLAVPHLLRNQNDSSLGALLPNPGARKAVVSKSIGQPHSSTSR